jgi:hypothetical protein
VSPKQALICAVALQEDVLAPVAFPMFRARLGKGAKMPRVGELFAAEELHDTLPGALEVAQGRVAAIRADISKQLEELRMLAEETACTEAERQLIDVALDVQTTTTLTPAEVEGLLNRVTEAARLVRKERNGE